MENAGRGITDFLWAQETRGPVIICCGKGNNAGDGFVIARHLDNQVYIETHDTSKVATLSISTFWFVLPTLPMFLVFPVLLNKGINFYFSLSISVLVMLGCYLITIAILRWFGVQF